MSPQRLMMPVVKVCSFTIAVFGLSLMLPLATLRPSLDGDVATGSDVLAIVAIVTVVGLLWVAAALSWWTAGQYMKAAGSGSPD